MANGSDLCILRARGKAQISLVAISENQVVGHALFSPITIASALEGFRGLGLAPVAVLPEFQNKGIGSRLIRKGVEHCQRAGFDAVVVLGHPKYYPRFGFTVAHNYGIENEYRAVGAFMVLELKDGALANISGLVKYAPEFREAGC